MARIDIILPAYNPGEGWDTLVIQRFTSLQRAVPDHQLGLVIVNDGSTTLDDTKVEAAFQSTLPGMRWISLPENQGKGYALRKGVESSTADMILYTDIDWPYDEASMLDMVHELEGDADAVIGVRNEKYYAILPKGRRRISKWLRYCNKKLLKLIVEDTQAGLKGFKAYLKPVFLSTTIDRYLFDLEFVYLLSRQKGMAIRGLPVMLREGVTFRRMKRKILLQEGMNFLRIWLRR